MKKMNNRVRIGAILVWVMAGPAVMADGATTQPASQLDTPAKQLGYALGLDIGASLGELGAAVDAEALIRGLQDSFNGSQPLMTPQKVLQVKTQAFQKIQQEQARKAQVSGQENAQKGQVFLEQNKDEDGVVTTASGLQYKVLKQGSGSMPTADDRVTVHYTGTLLDGTEFDSSVRRGEPATFPVKGVIAGWTEALQLMSVGSQYRLFIPSDLAYGDRGAGPKIGPNATLVFDVELLGIEP